VAIQLSTGMYSCQWDDDEEDCQNDIEEDEGMVQKPSSVAEM